MGANVVEQVFLFHPVEQESDGIRRLRKFFKCICAVYVVALAIVLKEVCVNDILKRADGQRMSGSCDGDGFLFTV